MNKFIASTLLIAAMTISCKSEQKSAITPLKSQTDSLAYVIGLSVADNLIAMDSTINLAAVSRAIAESQTSKRLFNAEEAKIYYLRYLTHVEPERKRGYEEQWLEDLAKSNRDFTRSNSGLTYNIAVIGDENLTPKGVNDLVSLRYTIKRVNGEQIFSSYDKADTLVSALSTLKSGLQEGLKMIGKGGKINAWIPSKLGYGQTGDQELNIAPFETLYYEVELIDMERNGAAKKSEAKR